MSKTTETQLEQIKKALYRQGIGLFECKSCYGDSNARQNLRGRTHYVDEDTLRYFKARILDGRKTDDGLLFVLVESVNSKPDHGGLNKRGVVFDVFGTVLTERDSWFRTSEQAAKFAREFVAGFDAVKHTRNEIKAKAKRDVETARETLKALRFQPQLSAAPVA